MTHTEFAAIMAFIGRTLNKPIPREQAECYFNLLGDLPVEALQAAAQRALLESTYPTVPTPGTLRQLAAEAMRPPRLAALQAWQLVRKALNRYSEYRQREALESLPPEVRRTVECFGWRSMCDSTEPEILRAQFCKAYDQLQAREDREALLPLALRGQVAALSSHFTEGIGQMPGSVQAIEDKRKP